MMNSYKPNFSIFIWLMLITCLLVIMILVGGITRLTGSGLSMVEWRPFLGILPPLTENEWIRIFDLYKLSPEYKLINSWMTITDFKFIFFWEYFHRIWGRLIGICFLIPFLYFIYHKKFERKIFFRTSLLFFLICIQGIIGWWMVKSGLSEVPAVSQYRLSIHLSMAFLILGITFWTALDLYEGQVNKIYFFDLIPLILISITIVAGTFVSGMDAGLVYNSFPYMGETIIPIEYGSLGLLDPFENPVTAQFHHRILAVITLIIIFLYSFNYLYKNKINFRIFCMVFSVFCQFIIGILTLINSVPVYLGALHQFGGIVLFLSALWLLHYEKKY